MSTFVPHLVADLSVKTVPATAPTASSSEGVQISSTQSKEALRSLFVKLEQSASPKVVRECIAVLQGLEHDQQLLSAGLADGEEHALRRAILSKLALELYAQALTTFLDEASEAERELEWWSDLGRSRRQVAYYLLQSESSPTVFPY